MFIIDVLGANLVILFSVIFWVVGAFFTMKNVFSIHYESIKLCRFAEDDSYKKDYYDDNIDGFDKSLRIIYSILFPFVYMWLGIKLFFNVLINHVFKNLFKFLDKVIPKIKFEKDEDES